MAEKGKTDSQLLYGVIVRATIERGSILATTLPPLKEGFYTLDAKDLGNNNLIAVGTDHLPLFAPGEISYKGEPIMALFGPDKEVLALLADEIEFDYQISQEELPPSEIEPLKFGWGDMQASSEEEESVVEKSYIDRPTATLEDTLFKVSTWIDGELLKIEAPTQWPFHLRDTVAHVCNRTQKSVVVYPQEHFSPKDEKLLLPSLLASIAAMATKKFGQPVELMTTFPTFKSGVTVWRKTYLSTKGKPLREEVKAIIDQGAFPLFSQEMMAQTMAGLIPLYQLEAFSAEVEVVLSPTYPAHFFGDLGYSSTLFSSEAHTSNLAVAAQMVSTNWRTKYYGESRPRNEYMETLPIPKLRDLIGETGTVADFSRHSAVYKLQKRTKQHLSPFFNYSRGVGIACGGGLSGFSTTSALHTASKISVTLDANNEVTINTSYYPSQKTFSLWRSIIIEELALEKETIVFVANDTSQMVDSGPEVLSLDVERSVAMLTHCCQAIKRKQFQEPLPISEAVSAKMITAGVEPLFCSKNWGCIILQLEVNTMTLEVEARQLWGRFTFSNAYDKELLKTKFKHIINSTLHEINIIPRYRKGAPPLIELEIENLEQEAFPSSATSAIRAMVMAAASAALSQALQAEVNAMPVTASDIIKYIGGEDED